MQFWCPRFSRATAWWDHYDAVQTCAVVLLYIQVGCALIGSLGAVYTGIVLANLALALFALVAIESGSQSLGRAYAGLLVVSLVLDIVWFCLFTNEIRHFGSETQLGKFGAFSVQLMFWMQAAGSGFRFVSSFLWVQMYRLGAMSGASATQLPVDFDGSNALFGSYNLGHSLPEHESAEFGRMDIQVHRVSVYDNDVFSPMYQHSLRHNDSDVKNNGQRSQDESQLTTPLLDDEP
ncbi:hypothetical protein M758_2G101200 [Ceratodon purpureus]|nr:hypothetical protein M758_2G101200 [Ceratodon purpureus]